MRIMYLHALKRWMLFTMRCTNNEPTYIECCYQTDPLKSNDKLLFLFYSELCIRFPSVVQNLKAVFKIIKKKLELIRNSIYLIKNIINIVYYIRMLVKCFFLVKV